MAKTYRQRVQQNTARLNELNRLARDIANEFPAVVNKRRKTLCKKSLLKFCLTYFKERLPLKFSADHIRTLEKMQSAIMQGGLFSLAMPRASGKSTLTECAAIWALVYGYRRFVVLIGASENASMEILNSIRMELEINDLLLQDFPEICFPIRKIDGITKRCIAQTYNNIRTRITLNADQITLPTIADSVASGSIIKVSSITGRIRGMRETTAQGESIRPDFFILDDIQSTESANSVEQCRKRLQIINSDVLGLAGAGKKISGFNLCTVISKGDVADQLLDSSKHPQWNGERIKMLKTFPTAEKLWAEYANIRADSLRSQGNIKLATAFYRANRKQMDQGAQVYWQQRFNADQLSAIQNAMNLYIQDANSFYSQYQNEPLSLQTDTYTQLTANALATKVNNLKRGTVPLACNRITAYVDIQKKCLFYIVMAWTEDFTGAVIDYGTFPQNTNSHFTLSNLKNTIQQKFPHHSLQAALYATLDEFTAWLMAKDWLRQDGLPLRIQRCMVDANWGQTTELVYKFCRQSAYSALLLPSHGKGITASQKPINEYRRAAGDRFGYNWYLPRAVGKRALRHIIYDTNFFKTFTVNKIALPLGTKGEISIYGNSRTNHDVLFEQFTAEYSIETSSKGRTVNQWKVKPNRDNHFFDCLTGNVVCANFIGIQVKQAETRKLPKQRISLKAKAEKSEQPTVAMDISADSTIGKSGRLSLAELAKMKRS